MTGPMGLKFALRRAVAKGIHESKATMNDLGIVTVATDDPQMLGQLEQKVYDLLQAKGTFTGADKNVEAIGTVNWLALIQALLTELPQIIALIMTLIG